MKGGERADSHCFALFRHLSMREPVGVFDGCIDGSFAEGRVASQAEFDSTSVFRGKDEPAVTSVNTGTTTANRTIR